jgi:hypothetical protein
MVRIWHAAIHGADFGTLRFVKVADALDAQIKINDIDLVPFGNGLDGALGLASAASDALLSNHVSHSVHLLPLKSFEGSPTPSWMGDGVSLDKRSRLVNDHA